MKDTLQDTLIDAIQSVFTMQRWNFLPKVETWVEAENVALTAHIGFALGKEVTDFNDKLILHFLCRCLLKPLNKKYLTDVSYRVRQALDKIIYPESERELGKAWKKLSRKMAEK